MKRISFVFLLVAPLSFHAQEIDSDLKSIKERLDGVNSYEAVATLNVDISFINMPEKHAKLFFERDKGIRFDSDDFVMIPKRGLDLSLQQLLDHEIITVYRGDEEINGQLLKVINVIPTDRNVDFSIATLYIDTLLQRLEAFEISTKKDGVYNVDFQFLNKTEILPNKVIIEFEVEKFKLPINFMGKDTEINRRDMKSEGTKKGSIFIDLDYQTIQYR